MLIMFMLQTIVFFCIGFLAVITQLEKTQVSAQYRLRIDLEKSGLDTDWRGGTDIVSYANSTSPLSIMTSPQPACC